MENLLFVFDVAGVSYAQDAVALDEISQTRIIVSAVRRFLTLLGLGRSRLEAGPLLSALSWRIGGNFYGNSVVSVRRDAPVLISPIEVVILSNGKIVDPPCMGHSSVYPLFEIPQVRIVVGCIPLLCA